MWVGRDGEGARVAHGGIDEGPGEVIEPCPIAAVRGLDVGSEVEALGRVYDARCNSDLCILWQALNIVGVV